MKLIEYAPAQETFRCMGCGAQIAIPKRVVRNPESMMMAKEAFEHIHVADGCDEAYARTLSAQYDPAKQVRALQVAWGIR